MFRAAALVIELDRLLALLDHLLQHRKQRLIRQRRLALPARLDVGVLERRVDHTQRRDPALVLGLHRVFHGIIDVVAQHGKTSNRLIFGNFLAPQHSL